MNKQLLFLASVFISGGLFAQTVIFEDDFESYTAGMGVAEQSDTWTTWTGSAGEDADVSADFANSGSNSFKIDNSSNDIILPVGPYTSGKYDLKFMMYMPQGNGGYFNALHAWEVDNTAYEWAVDVFFSSTGDITWVAEGAAGGGASFDPATWFEVQVTADMDSDVGTLYINGESVATWQWSINNGSGAAGMNQLRAFDFYGTVPDGSGPVTYYIDDVQLIETTTVAVAEASKNTAGFYPNPANSELTIQYDFDQATSITIFNLSGQKVIDFTAAQAGNRVVDTSVLPAGIYFIEVRNSQLRRTEKLVIQH